MIRQRAHRNKGLRGPSRGSTRDKRKIDFFRAENLGYTNNRPSLSSKHRSASPSGELSNGDGSPVRFLISTAGHRILSVFISTTDASILSPSIRSPHGSANGYASIETYLLFAIYLPLRIGSLGQFWNAPRPSYERAAELETFVSFLFSFVYQVKT